MRYLLAWAALEGTSREYMGCGEEGREGNRRRVMLRGMWERYRV